MFEGIILMIIFSCLIFFSFRWTLIDPHNVEATSSILYIAGYALLLAFLWGFAVSPINEGKGAAASVISSFVLGAIAAPAISSPDKLTVEEEPSWIKRWLSEKKLAFGGVLVKSIIVFPLATIGTYLGYAHPEYWIVVTLALYLSFSKFGVVVSLNGKYFQRSYLGSALLGTLCLAIVFTLMHPFHTALPPFSIGEFWPVFALWCGFVCGP